MPDPVEGAADANPTYAGFWIRVAATVIDTVVLFVPWCWMALIALAGGRLATRTKNYDSALVDLSALFLASLVTPLLYYSLMERSAWQGTIGKLMFKLYVTDVHCRRLGFGRAIGRNAAKLLSSLTLGVRYIICGFTSRKQALHDIVAGSLVLHRPRQR